jgi:R.HinP1I restriction endonuclease
VTSRLSSCARVLSIVFSLALTFSALHAQQTGKTQFEPATSPTPKGQKSREEEVKLGSQTAKRGFQNEDEVRDKFNDWRNDADARSWLEAMNYRLSDIEQVSARKPHGEKADVEVKVKTKSTEKVEGISIKLVSNPQGFNQIDKRWLKTYAQKWSMPEEVHAALKLFVGEVQPTKPGRDPRRMFLKELSEQQQQAVVSFFTKNRQLVVSDLFAGDGEHAAGWMMVTLKSFNDTTASDQPTSKRSNSSKVNATEKTSLDDKKQKWVLCSSDDVAKFFGSGEIQITPAGSLKIGRITMQRKGGDNGRESANMLQFKINPTELFELKK